MPRPPSIRQFDLLFLASVVLWALAQALSWEYRMGLLAGSATAVPPVLVMTIGLLVIGGVSVAVWYFAAKRGALAAKWAAVALGACSAVGLALSVPGLIAAGGPSPLAKLVSVLASLACIAAALLLFRPDAKTWFAEDGFADHERDA